MEIGTEAKWILGITALLVLTELLRPRFRISIFSQENRENLFWLGLNKVAGLAGLSWLIYFINSNISRFIPVIDLKGLPFFVQFLMFFLLSDFISYCSHRFLHAQSYLWRFHKLHHSSKELTTFSAFRHHFFEDLYYAVALGSLTGFMVLDEALKLVVFVMITGVCYFQHANVKVRFPNWVEYIFITPLNHRWHHSTEVVKSKGQNFGLFLSIWDRMFGTYYVPEFEPKEMGIKEEYPESVWKRVIEPFIP